MAEQSVEQQVLDLVTPGVQIIFYLSDGTTARVRALHDGKRPLKEDIQDTLLAAQEAEELIQVDSLDSETGGVLERFIVPSAVIAVVYEQTTDALASVA